LENLPVEFGKLQSLVELDLSDCSQLGCLPDSIVHLSQLETFRLSFNHKLENLPVEFGKLQSLVAHKDSQAIEGPDHLPIGRMWENLINR
jgi:Leucine-rich repeat (LRR) protein